MWRERGRRTALQKCSRAVKRFVIEAPIRTFGNLFFKQIHPQRSLERLPFPHITSSPPSFAELSIPFAFRNRFGATQREAFRRILLVTSIAPIFLPILPLSGGGSGAGEWWGCSGNRGRGRGAAEAVGELLSEQASSFPSSFGTRKSVFDHWEGAEFSANPPPPASSNPPSLRSLKVSRSNLVGGEMPNAFNLEETPQFEFLSPALNTMFSQIPRGRNAYKAYSERRVF